MDRPTAPRIEGLAASYPLGAVISGDVVVEGADEVTVALVFETSGRCDPDRGLLHQVSLGPCTGSVPFRLEGPRWPPTYEGTLFAGRWSVEATAVSGGRRASTRAVVEVRPGDGALQVTSSGPSPTRRASGTSRRTRLAVLVLLEVVCLAVVVVGAMTGSAVAVAGLLVGGVLLLPLIGTAQGFLGHRAAGELTSRLHQQGDLLVVEAHLERVDAVESVTAALEVSEAAQRWEGDRSEARHHVVHRHLVGLDPDGSGGFSGRLPLTGSPPLPPTMRHSRAQVEWSVQVRAVLRGSPDIVDTTTFVVRSAAPEGGPWHAEATGV